MRHRTCYAFFVTHVCGCTN